MGGSGSGMGNLISGNGTGVNIHFTGGGTVAGNWIGLDATGTKLIPNTNYGIDVQRNRSGVTIGGITPAHGNVIAGAHTAIELFYADAVTVQNNSIGTHNGVKLGGLQVGVYVYQTDDAVVTHNTISGCARAAVHVDGTALRNEIRQNSIYDNHFGIELASYPPDYDTPNDSDDSDVGPNNLQNYPVITQVQSNTTVTRIIGSLTSTKNTSFTVDLYASPTCSSYGHGEGQTHIGSFALTTNASGLATFDQLVSTALSSGSVVTATATTPLEGTSEFSACATVQGPGLFTIEAPGPVIEGQSAIVTVHRTSGANGPVSVDYWTTAAGASASDFTPASGTLTFGHGEQAKTVSIATIDDATYESNEVFLFAIGNPTGGAVLGSPSTRDITIKDNDPAPYLQINDIEVMEGDSGTTPATLTLTLTQPVTTPVTFSYYTYSGGWDYQTASGSVTFQPGETVKNVTVHVYGDTTVETDELFVLHASGPFSVDWGTFTILNDDEPPTIAVDDTTVTETDGTQTAKIRLTASAPILDGVHVTLISRTARAGEDFYAFSGWVGFFNTTEATVSVIIAGDDEPEPNEQFAVSLYSATYDVTDSEGIVTILNDDTGVGPSHQRIAVGESAAYAIELGAAVTVPTTVHFELVGSGVTVPASITIHPGESRATFDVRATEIGSARINVILPGATHSVTAMTYIARKLTFTPNELSLYVGQVIPVTVSLSPAADDDVTIALDSKSDSIQLPSTVVIPAGGTATFDVKAVKEGPIVVHTADSAYGTSGLFGHVSTTPTTPAILRIAPPTGPTAGGTSLEVTGVHFRAECTMTFDGLPASVRFVSATELEVTTPPHDEGTVDVELSCGEHLWRFANGFTYVGASPEVTSVVPAFGNIAGGTEVRIAGANFRSSCWPFFGGVAAPRATVESATSIAATVPPHGAGAVDVLLRCTGSEALRNAAFNYTTTPEPQATIESVDPLAGAPGQPVTVTGLRFRTTDRIVFGEAAATILSTRSGQHVVRVPELPLGKTAVTLTDANGNVTTTGPIFTVLADVPPIITAIAPSSLPAGAELRLDGRGFRPGYLFRIGGKNATIASLTYTTLVLRLDPSTAPGDYDIEIYNAAASLAGIGPRVRVTSGGVSIASIDVPCATTEGGLNVTINGSGFAEGAIVRFNSVLSTGVLVVDASTLRAVVPAGEAGPSAITVANPDGTHARLTGKFKLVSPFDPNGGCSNAGRSRSVRH